MDWTATRISTSLLCEVARGEKLALHGTDTVLDNTLYFKRKSNFLRTVVEARTGIEPMYGALKY